jgi:hypothetical protein
MYLACGVEALALSRNDAQIYATNEWDTTLEARPSVHSLCFRHRCSRPWLLLHAI